jgi:hypothetical protein
MSNSNVIAGLKKFVPFLKSEPRLSHRTVLSVRPVRHPLISWERKGPENLVVTKIPRPKQGRMREILARWFVLPDHRVVEMADELSSMVWELCDGNHTVGQITDRIAREYKLSSRQAEVGVLALLRTLQAKRMIGVPVQPAVTDAEREHGTSFDSGIARAGFYANRKRSRIAR